MLPKKTQLAYFCQKVSFKSKILFSSVYFLNNILGPPSVQFQQAQNIGPQGFFNASPHVVQGSAQLLDQTQVGQGNQLQNPYQKEVPLASSFFGISVQPEPAFLVPKDPPQTQYSEDSCSQIESFSVSEPIGSTLSLFATSEFVDDSSSNRDTSVVNPELLISTYLKQTSEQEQDVIDQNCSSFSPSEGQDGKTLFKLTSEELLKLLENPDQHEVDIMAALDSLDGAAPATR